MIEMMGMRYYAIALVAYRNFGTKSSGKNKNWFHSRYRKKAKGVISGSKEARESRSSIKWTDQQKQIISAVSEGKSVFITG